MSTLINYIDLHKEEVIDRIKSFITEAKKTDNKIPLYSDALERLSSFATQGKTMRGIMVLASYEMFGRREPKDVIDIAAAVEIVHSALLIHDDIIDDDELRRGNKTIFAQYQEEEGSKFYGQSMAICVGDIAFFLAYDLISSAQIPDDVKNKVIRYFSKELLNVGAAEMEDFHFGATNDEPTIESILNMYRLKSARYTFSLPLVIGATVANKDQETIEKLEKFGEHLGIVFQIVDDALGITGDSSITGKPVGSDIRQNKKTVFRRYLYDASTDTKELDEIFGKTDVSSYDVEKIKVLAKKLKVQIKIDELISLHLNEARQILADLDMPDKFRSFFEELIEYNLHRNK